MKRFIAMVALGCAVMSLAACSGSSTAGPAKLNADGSFPTESGKGSDQEALAWSLVRVDKATNRIYFDVSNNSCSYPQAAVVGETPTSVTLTVYGNTVDPSTACAANQVTTSTWVATKDAVGSRQVLHGQ